MGVERIACLLQGVDNVYETDLLRPVIDKVAEYSPRGYGRGNHDDDVRYRVIADHSRTAAIIIGDGVTPSNEGRGYVLRRLCAASSGPPNCWASSVRSSANS